MNHELLAIDLPDFFLLGNCSLILFFTRGFRGFHLLSHDFVVFLEKVTADKLGVYFLGHLCKLRVPVLHLLAKGFGSFVLSNDFGFWEVVLDYVSHHAELYLAIDSDNRLLLLLTRLCLLHDLFLLTQHLAVVIVHLLLRCLLLHDLVVLFCQSLFLNLDLVILL
jgi:hypothetical protein